MKTSILSVSVRGAKLGQEIREKLSTQSPDMEIVCYEKEGRESGGEAISFSKMGPLMEELFPSSDRILCIMATGIVVRTIAPFIVHKSADPAVVVMDERANFVISLLSGHLGGANEWTKELAELTKAVPVITTATDVNDIPAPDMLARKLALTVDSFDALVSTNAALVNGEKVHYYVDASLLHAEAYQKEAMDMGIALTAIPFVDAEVVSDGMDDLGGNYLAQMTNRIALEQALMTAEGTAWDSAKSKRVFITDRLLDVDGEPLFLRPKTMTLGIGCRRDTPKELILDAVKQSLFKQKRSLKSVIGAASVIVKVDEVGLLEAMSELGLGISFFTQEQIAPTIEEQALNESNFVKETIGVGNVCETTALLLAKSNKLLQHKTVYPKTTVAIAKADWSLSELDQEMRAK